MKTGIKLTEQGGYLIVEYLVSISLMVIVMLVLFTIINITCRATEVCVDNSNLHYSAYSALSQIKSDALGARSIKVLGNGHVLRIDTGSEFISYYVQNSQLYRQGGSKLPVSEHARSVTFRCLRPGLVEVSYEAGVSGRSYLLQSAYNVRCRD